MIDDLDRTLAQLVRQSLGPELVEQVAISFEAPDDQFPPSSVAPPALDLFLYDVRENRELRTNEWEIDRDGGVATKRRSPTRVECSYLVTAWASETSTTPALDEHHLLGEAIRALLRHRSIPPELLQGRLAGQRPPLPTTVLQAGRLQSLAEFWQALGGKPKAALNYTVTIGVDSVEPPITAPLVTEEVLRMRLEEPT